MTGYRNEKAEILASRELMVVEISTLISKATRGGGDVANIHDPDAPAYLPAWDEFLKALTTLALAPKGKRLEPYERAYAAAMRLMVFSQEEGHALAALGDHSANGGVH